MDEDDRPLCETCGEPIDGPPRIVQMPIFQMPGFGLVGFDTLEYHPNCTP
jgi:hypothetical protein